MSEKYNTGRDLHRIRTRAAPAVTVVEWDALQTLLGFAFTVQQELHRLRRESQTAKATDSASTAQPAFYRIVSTAKNLTEASGAALALGSAESMVCVASCGESAPPVGVRVDMRSGLSGECVRTGESAICVNSAADPRVDYQACRTLGIRSMLYMPLHAQGKLIGMLGVFSATPLHFSQRDLNCLRFIEGLVVEAVDKSAVENEPSVNALLKQVKRAHSELPASEEKNVPKASEAKPAPKPEIRHEAKPEVKAVQVVIPKPEPVKPAISAVPTVVPAPPKESLKVLPTPVRVAEPVPATPKPEPILVARVVDESVANDPSELPSFTQQASEGRNILPFIVALAVVCVVIAAFVWTGYGRLAHRPTTVQTPAAPAIQPAAPVITPKADPVDPARWLTPGIRFWSEPGHAVITVSLDKAIQYQGFTLHNPDRIYFDLHGIVLADAKGLNFDIDNSPISRIRIAETGSDTTRMVFDLRAPSTYTATLSAKPDVLVIDVNSSPAANSTDPSNALVMTPAAKLTVVIDPGHGGHDLGTISPSGLQEKDVVLDVAERLGKLLQEKMGANVIYTRKDDTFIPLADRAQLANQSRADFFISIHANSSPVASVRGVETYYFKSSSQALVVASSSQIAPGTIADDTDSGREFAADVQHALYSNLADTSDTLRDRGVKPADFVVLREAQMPAVLAEISFITSRRDVENLKGTEYRERIAKALYQGILRHIKRYDTRPAPRTELAAKATVDAKN